MSTLRSKATEKTARCAHCRMLGGAGCVMLGEALICASCFTRLAMDVGVTHTTKRRLSTQLFEMVTTFAAFCLSQIMVPYQDPIAPAIMGAAGLIGSLGLYAIVLGVRGWEVWRARR